jgi:ribonucleoside-triphosphate reductase
MEINIRLGKNFTTQYNRLQNDYGTELARINGFDDGQLSYTDFIDEFIDKETVADASIDGNSNVSHKDIVTLLSEMPKPHRKLLAFNKIYYEYQKKYGFKAANEWLRMEWEGKLYMHDGDTSTFKHYCFAYDLKDLAEKGLYFIGGNFNAEPPKHLITFVDFVKEFIGYASNRSSGAVGLPNLLPYMFYFWNKDIEEDYLGIRTSGCAQNYAIQNFQRFIYAVNQPYVRDGQQSAFTNTSVFDRPYFEALFGGSEFPDGTFMIDYEDDIIEFQKWYMDVMAEIRHKNMFTFPVSTISLLRKEGDYNLNTLDAYEDPEFAEWAIRHNMVWSDSNIFQDTSVSSLSNCCRLKSDIRDLGYFNSIGGTALKVGSVKVSTINLARLALDTDSVQEFLDELAHRTLVNVRALDVVRNIIKRNVEKGLLPNFSYGLVDFEHLYNTIGFIGVYEAMKKFGYTWEDMAGNVHYEDPGATYFGQKIFETMRRVADDFIKSEGVDYMINTEQIPGESAAAKLMKKDKFFYPDANIYDLPLYGNQFIPLGITTTLRERVRIQAMFDGFCNGGSILHVNIDAPFDSFEKALKMTNYIAQQGVTYFAFNTKIQACENNHAFYGTTCPVCGKPIATEYTRVVGFYTPIKTWSKERKKEYSMRRWEGISKTAEAI